MPAFIQPSDITSGNRRLNLAFVAQIFNTNHGLDAKAEDLDAARAAMEAAELEEEGEGADASREATVFTKWLNGLNIGEKQINNLFDDLNDGLMLLDAINKVVPGAVEEKKVNRDPAKLNRFKKVENCNLAVTVGKTIGVHLPGTGGMDLAGGNKKLVLGFVWQLMRMEVVKMLETIGGGAAPKDADIIAWANETVKEAGVEAAISSFKDAELGTGCVRRRPSLLPALPAAAPPRLPPRGRLHAALPRLRPRSASAPAPQRLPAAPAQGVRAARHQPRHPHGGRDGRGAHEELQVRHLRGAQDRRQDLPLLAGHLRRQAQDDHVPRRLDHERDARAPRRRREVKHAHGTRAPRMSNPLHRPFLIWLRAPPPFPPTPPAPKDSRYHFKNNPVAY